MKQDTQNMTVGEILIEYERQVKANGLAISDGDPNAANEAYQQVWNCSNELKRRGTEAQKALLKLLHNTDPQVRLCAAKDALDFAPDLGVAELESLAGSQLIWALDAQMILREWKRGKLKFP